VQDNDTVILRICFIRNFEVNIISELYKTSTDWQHGDPAYSPLRPYMHVDVSSKYNLSQAFIFARHSLYPGKTRPW